MSEFLYLGRLKDQALHIVLHLSRRPKRPVHDKHRCSRSLLGLIVFRITIKEKEQGDGKKKKKEKGEGGEEGKQGSSPPACSWFKWGRC